MLKKTKLISMMLLAGTIAVPEGVFAETTPIRQGVNITQQNGKVTGIVEDAFGPITGASVVVKGTTNGNVTDVDGKFTLDGVKKGDIIRISFIGYLTQDVPYTGQSSLRILLKEDSQALEEVVVVGYATVKKANLTGAVSSVDEKVLQDRPIVNLGQGLQGAIPNLNITTSGRPGTGSSFNVRGYTSINGGNPLVLVDGVEMDPNLINPQDVKSVSVLKDAASASIYGARAAYGVVLITTKGGRKDQPTQISLEASVSFNGPTTRPTYMNSWEYANWMNKASRNTWGRDYFDQEWMGQIKNYYDDPVNNSPVFVHSNPNESKNGRLYTYCGNTDWMDILYKKNYPVQKYNVNISGGTEKATYYTSLGYTDQGSLMNYGNEKFKKFNVMNNINYDINTWLHFSMKTTYNRTELSGLNQTHIHGDNFIGGDTRPLMPVKHPDGNWAGQGNFTNFPAVLEDGGSRTTTKDDFWNTIALKLTPLKGLSLNADYTFNYYSEHGKFHGKEFNEYGVDGQFLQTFAWSIPNFVQETQNNDTYNAFNLFGDYEKTFGKHYLKGMVGFNEETKHTRYFYGQRDELISNDLPSMNAAVGEKNVGNSDDSWATRSTFFRVNYAFADRYLLEINGRYDLSSKFPKADRAVFNPSFSAAWKIAEEKWFKNATNSFFDDLKIRGSYGSLGNQALDNGWYAYLSNYGTGQSGWLMGGNRPQYILPGSLVSSSITWETVTQWDLGLDFALLNSRLKGAFDYYQRTTSDMLTAGKTLPGILGASEPQANAADLRTSGWEFEVSWNDQLENGLHYTIGFNLSDSYAEITKFDNPTRDLGKNYEGKRIGEIWGYVTEGLFQSEDEIAKAPKQDKVSGGVKLKPGDIRFANLNGDDRIDWGDNTVDNPGDMKVIGNNQARYRYGINLAADWKGFDLGIFLQGVGKRDVNLPGMLFKSHYGSEWSVPSGINTDYWSEDNRDAYFPVPRFDGGSAIGQAQTRYLQSGAYCRLKSLTLGYSLPKSILSKVAIEKCRIYFSGENLLTFKSSPEGFDPELDDPYKYPLQKAVSVGLSVTF